VTGIPIGKIALSVIDGACQDVQIVMECVELGSCNHQFVLAEFEFARTLPCYPVPLPTSLGTELLRPTSPHPLREHTSTPPASIVFRHDEIVDGRLD